MNEPVADGLTLLVSHSGRRSNWSLDLLSLRPFVSRVLLVENGGGAYLLPPLRRVFPDISIDSLLLPEQGTPGEHTRRLHQELGAMGDWLLVLQAGSNLTIGRRFRIPRTDQPQSAIHLSPARREAYWAPVLVPKQPDRVSVGPSGELVIDVPFDRAECNGGLVVDMRNRPIPDTKMLAGELESALAAFRNNGSAKLCFDVGQGHFRLRRYVEAEFWYQRYFNEGEDDENRWTAQYRYALCLQAQGRPWPAVEKAMAAAFDIDPNRAEPLYYIAQHYLEVASYSKAFDLSAIGLEIDMPEIPQPFEYPVYQYELPLVYMSCAAELRKDRECVRVANRILRRLGVPDEARAEAAKYRSRCIDGIQPVYPLNIRKRNRVVVITPFRNAGEFLRRCMDSLAAQDYGNCRFVLIDDASTDDALDGLDVSDPRFVVERNETRRGVIRNQIDTVNKYCHPDDIAVYVDGDDRLLDNAALTFINDFFNSTRCWLMYGQYRDSNGRYGYCEPITDESSDVLSAIGGMHFPMHIRAHRAGLIGHLQRIDPELSRLRGDDGEFLDAIADMALMRALMQLAGLENIRYNDRILYEYNARNPESHYSEFERKQLQDHQSQLLTAREPIEKVSSYLPHGDLAIQPPAASRKTEVLFIALDGMSPYLLHEWGSEGLLPNIGRVFQRGYVRDICAPKGFGNDVFWISLSTGSLPDEVGYYYRNCWVPDPGNFKVFDPGNELEKPPFWSELADTDLEMAVVDFPEIRHAGRINGLEVTEWMTHARLSNARFFPAALKDDWIGRFGTDPTHGSTETLAPRNGEQFVKLRDDLLESVEQNTRAALHYIDRGGWDFFALAYSQGHDVGHQFWHVHDPEHPRHRPTWLQRYGDPVLQMYQCVDQAVGRVIEAAGENAKIVVVSGLAMEAKVSCNAVLNRVLWEIEKAEFASRNEADSPGHIEQRLFFSVPHNNLSGAVRINLRGRENPGLIEPGAEYKETLDRLERCLGQVINKETGEPVVSEFVRIRDVYTGPRVDALPDMVVMWNRSSPVRWISSPWFEEIEVRPRSVTDTRSGDHICKAEMVSSFEPPFPPRESIPVQNLAPWLEGLIRSGRHHAPN